jgi:hypothetical protein
VTKARIFTILFAVAMLATFLSAIRLPGGMNDGGYW